MQGKSLSEFLSQFVPFYDTAQNSIDVTTELLDEHNLDTFHNIFAFCNLPPSVSSRLMYKLLKSAILELINSAKLVKFQNKEKLRKIVDSLMRAFTKMWGIWNCQDMRSRMKKEEDESLYINKTNEPSDEEMLDQNLKHYFPSFEQVRPYLMAFKK